MQRIFLVGFMGSGKTTMGKLLAKTKNINFIDLDQYIENKYCTTIARIFQIEGEESFRLKERQCLHEILEIENVVISTGGGTPCFFDNMERMNKCGTTIYLQLTPLQLANRLRSSKHNLRPLLNNMSTDQRLGYITETLQNREKYYLQAAYVVTGTDQEMERWFREFR